MATPCSAGQVASPCSAVQVQASWPCWPEGMLAVAVATWYRCLQHVLGSQQARVGAVATLVAVEHESSGQPFWRGALVHQGWPARGEHLPTSSLANSQHHLT